VWYLAARFQPAGRLGAEYVSEDNSRKHPVMLHRAILGSFERFVGILIEHYEGAFPAWLAPTQAVIMNITDKQADFALKLKKLSTKAVSCQVRLEK
jgi:threonyl-tRNA synthetase